MCRLHSRKWNRKNYKGPLSWCWVCSIIQPARIWAKHREYTCCSSKNLVLIGFIVLTALTSDLTRWTDFTGFKLKKKKEKKKRWLMFKNYYMIFLPSFYYMSSFQNLTTGNYDGMCILSKIHFESGWSKKLNQLFFICIVIWKIILSTIEKFLNLLSRKKLTPIKWINSLFFIFYAEALLLL